MHWQYETIIEDLWMHLVDIIGPYFQLKLGRWLYDKTILLDEKLNLNPEIWKYLDRRLYTFKAFEHSH